MTQNTNNRIRHMEQQILELKELLRDVVDVARDYASESGDFPPCLDKADALLEKISGRFNEATSVATGTPPEIEVLMELSAATLYDALDFVAPDALNPQGVGTDEEMAQTVVLFERHHEGVSENGDRMPVGLYCFLAECPEEGCHGPLGLPSGKGSPDLSAEEKNDPVESVQEWLAWESLTEEQQRAVVRLIQVTHGWEEEPCPIMAPTYTVSRTIVDSLVEAGYLVALETPGYYRPTEAIIRVRNADIPDSPDVDSV